MTNERPSVEHLRVFGSGAYVFLPAEIWANKLSPKSELMTYLGTAPGSKGWIFMRSPNNVVFTAAQATFDESYFPWCPKTPGVHANTKVQEDEPYKDPCTCQKNGTCHCPVPGDEEETTLSQYSKGKQKESRPQPARDQQYEQNFPPLAPAPPPPAPQRPEPRRSGRAVPPHFEVAPDSFNMPS